MAMTMSSNPDVSVLDEEPGMSFWGKMKLSKLSQVIDLAQELIG
jgi:hypothetical protein